MGFKPDRILIFVYAFEGFLIGLAAVAHTSIMRQVDPNAFLGFEMQVIAAVVLGGASVLGGYGSILGTLIGVSLFCVINNGLILMHIPTFWQKIVVGLIIIGSISIDMTEKKRTERNKTRVDVE
jgi:ribose/xylose/arabinose/galactoside ABC-type transport system permease subunit